MASLLPILQEILPMIMPGSVHITKAEELRRPPGLPHHSEDEADPSDQAEEEEEEEDDDDDDDDLAIEDDRMTSFTDNASATAAWRSTFPRRSDRSERGQLSQLSLLQSPSPSNAHLQEPRRETARPRRTNSDSAKPNSRATKPTKPKSAKNAHVRIANGVSLRDAIVHKSGSLCASILTVKPSCETVVFHNGEQEAIVYAVSGTAELATLPEDFDEYDSSLETQSHDASSLKSRPEPAKHTIGAGDFAFIPAWTEHQVRNVEEHEGAANVVWVVVRNASEPTVVPLEGWGGEAK